MYLIYLLIAAIAFGISMLLWKVRWRKSAWYRVFWIVGVCVFLRHQFVIWHFQASFRDIGGPDGGFAGMALFYLTMFSLPLTAVGFFLCFSFPRDGRVLHWSSALTLALTLGIWAGVSWLWHHFGGPNTAYKLRAIDQRGQPVEGARLTLEVSARQERVLEIPYWLASAQGAGTIRSTLVLTSAATGAFSMSGERAERILAHALTHPDYLYHPRSPNEAIQRNHIFTMWKKGTNEPEALQSK
jgi:hypothetical protein